MTIILLAIGITAGAAGCTADQVEEIKAAVASIAGQRETVQMAADKAVADKAEMDAEIAAMPDGPAKDKAVAKSEKIGKIIEAYQEWLDRADATISALQAGLVEANDALDVAEAGLHATTPYLPLPWGALATGIGGLTIGLLRAYQNRKAGRNIAASVADIVAKELDLSPESAARLSAAQGATAKRIVDEAQGTKAVVPF